MITIANIKSRLGRKFRGSSIDDIQGISDFSLFEEAADNLLAAIDPYETVRLHRFDFFDGIYDYAAPSYLKGKKVIDPRPQEGRVSEDFLQTFVKDFDREKWRKIERVSVEFLEGTKVIRMSGHGEAAVRVDDTSDATNWSAAGGASGLEVDDVLQLDDSDSLRFDLGATGGYIENSTITEIDLDAHEDASSFFRKVYVPSGASSITSVTIRIGSSSGNYWTITGEIHFGSWKNGVNIVRFDWADATETGAPDASAIDYERLTFVTSASIADVRIGQLSSRMPTPFEIPLYANQIFKEGSTWLDDIEDATTEDDVTIVLEREAQNLFFYECCIIAAEDLSLDDEAEKFRRKLYGHPGKDDDGGLYGQYKRDKPGEALRPQTDYISFRNRGRRPTRRP